jgi:hypothetical protein
MMQAFILGVVVGMLFAGGLFNYVFWMAERKEQAIRYVRQRIRF